MSRILFFMPDNPLRTNSGNKTRAKSFLTYFRDKGHHVDFFTELHWGEWTQKDIEEFQNSGLSDNIYVLDRKSPKHNFIKYNLIKLRQTFINKINGVDTRDMPNHATKYLLNQFYRILKNKQYDYVIINYATWARMAINKDIFKGAKLIIDTHDFIASQRQKSSKDRIGRTFAEELKRLDLFDDIWAISPEEHYVFGQFMPNKVRWVPMMTDNNISDIVENHFKYDIIYVASDNAFNKISAQWFMDKVYPLLSKDIRICIVGKIGSYVIDQNNIEKIAFVEDLRTCYSQARIAICPMLGGTGLKIKVVEAMSFGLPIVCNERGLDGIPNKVNNGCLVSNDPEEFARYIHLLINDRNMYQKYREQAQSIFNMCFEKQVCYKRLDEIFI